jgi:5-(carboxyamino)imidazole ribonucleotide synthase
MQIIAPGSTIGILGGGQLGRMLAIAAMEMGYHVHIYCPEEDSPASHVATHTTVAAYDDVEALKKFAAGCDIVTYEFENIPAAPLSAIADKIRPGIEILAMSQHRVREKQAVNKLGVATAPFAPVNSQEDLKAAIRNIGLPAVLKTATMGYDGKGQWKIKAESDLPALAPGEYILEGFVEFRMEISVIVARDAQGNIACYVPVQNTHKNHILHETIAPAPISEALAKKAEGVARAIAEGIKLVGLMAVEMFVTGKDEILVNELAPRPHNSGHWTIDACVTSQFEQCVRAICGLPLGNPARLCDARMLNLIGDDINDWQKYVQMPGAKLHLYGKKDARPGRKMGHVTFLEI